MSKRTGLGKGLGAFFGNEIETGRQEKKTEPAAQPVSAEKTAGDHSIKKETEKKESEKLSLADLDMVLPAAHKAAKKSGAGTERKPARTEVKIVEVEKEKMVNLSLIEPNRGQPRKQFDEEALQELADSIRNFGVLQPLIVKKSGDTMYELIAGERRWRAARLAGLREVPVIVREYSRQQTMEIALIENVQREDLNPIEEARAYQMLIQEFGLKQEEVAERVSKNRATITNSMRLLKLDERVQEMLVENKISGGHARALLALEDGEQQYQAALKIISNKWSVREVERFVKSMGKTPAKREADPEKERMDLFYRDLEERLKSLMGTKVSINQKDKNKGRIEIEYYSSAELERIIEMLQSVKN